MIQIRNLNKYYNKGKTNEFQAIYDTTVTLPNTGLICILGESGSGKTTFLNTVSGLDDFADGTIEIDGTVIKKYGEKKQEQIRNQKFGYIFQNYYLLMERTVEYNILLALSMYDISEQEKEERVDYVLRAVNMWQFKKRLVSQLSGGQQQRIAIARALVKAPSVIFADEPTGNLDEANTMNIMGILKKISQKCLVVVVTHEKNIADFFADRIIWIEDGELVRDEQQEGKKIYQYVEDPHFYLKEFEENKVSEGNVELSVYHREETPKITLKLVYDNGNIYLSTENNGNVEFLTEESEHKVIDSKRPKVEQKDVDQIQFELKPVESAKKPRLSFREIREITRANLKTMGKKKIFLMVVLFFVAVVATFSFREVMSQIYINTEDVVKTDTHLYKISAVRNSGNEAVSSILEERQKYFGQVLEELQGAGYEVYRIPDTELVYEYEGFIQMENYSFELRDFCFVPLDKLSEDSLMYGKMPESDTEVVLDRRVVENLRESASEVESVITDISQVIGNQISTKQGITLTITGICETGQPDIYAGENLFSMLSDGYVADMECYVYADDSDVEGELRKISSVFSEDVRAHLQLSIENEAYNQIESVKMERRSNLEARVLVIAAILIISILMIYFIMKSDANQRMQDLSVYRMLGVPKRNMIGMYVWQNFLLTTYSSLVGVLLTVAAIRGLLDVEYMVFPWYAVPLIIAGLYLINILMGILTIWKLIKLPPAQIAARYDV